ncbi:TadE/TadG family type IV pilus assembly protein [Parafrankia sp. BMG5.11]|uniref:TadE/TadG family type IV pilus assembly protein n=1 Tax=Parafrankia sp. BMG5.11 TaxID=222540 RepID=UPI0010398FFE|nr:TadE/TadG family type IV pilus assembly protein [Parafrankia sp. BMG5.11]TCJ32289.1 pilus assembly protein [Parafrankia sp. BMG5.11]
MRAIGNCLRKLRGDCSGNALMLTAVALPALLGAAGYGIDTAQWYMLQRELQHASDQGAIAGAWNLAYKDVGSTYDNRARKEFAANLGIATGYASTINPNVARGNFQGGTNNSVVVTAEISVQLPFSRLITSSPTLIRVASEAAFAPGTVHKACLRTLKTGAAGTFQVGNGATLIANCGVIAISCEPEAIRIDENATIEIAKITACNHEAASLPSTFSGELVVDSTIGSYVNELFGPEPAGDEPTSTYNCANAPKKGTYTVSPGVYDNGIKIACNTIFSPGVYYVRTELDLTHNAVVSGYGVMFVLLDGATLKMGGSGANGTGTGGTIRSSLNLTPPTHSKLLELGYSDEFAKKFENVLIITDDTEAETDHIINGNANMHIQGKLHLPKGNVKVNGNAQAADGVCFQITSYTLDVSGGAYLYTLCSQEETQALESQPGVRLIS